MSNPLTSGLGAARACPGNSRHKAGPALDRVPLRTVPHRTRKHTCVLTHSSFCSCPLGGDRVGLLRARQRPGLRWASGGWAFWAPRPAPLLNTLSYHSSQCLSTYCVPGTVLDPLHKSFHSVLETVPWTVH